MSACDGGFRYSDLTVGYPFYDRAVISASSTSTARPLELNWPVRESRLDGRMRLLEVSRLLILMCLNPAGRSIDPVLDCPPRSRELHHDADGRDHDSHYAGTTRLNASRRSGQADAMKPSTALHLVTLTNSRGRP